MVLRSVLILCVITFCDGKNIQIVSRTRTSYMEKYESYANVIMTHLRVPQDTLFASFMFMADEMQMSIFGCPIRNVSLYMKQGSPPVINPDGSIFPENFRNITRSKLYNHEFVTDKQEFYINITSPEPGSYYVITFLSYTDPRYNAIQQQEKELVETFIYMPELSMFMLDQIEHPIEVIKFKTKENVNNIWRKVDVIYINNGSEVKINESLTPSCRANVETTLYIEKADTPLIISENDLIEVVSSSMERRYFKFYVQGLKDHGILSLNNIYLSENVDNIVIRLDINKPPSPGVFQKEELFYPNVSSGTISFWTKPQSWHYLEIQFHNKTPQGTLEALSNLTFSLMYYSNELSESSACYKLLENKTLYNNSISRNFHTNRITDLIPYKQYDLVREASTESFLFSYELKAELDSNTAIPINMTSEHFSLLKFEIREGTDIGGTLQFIVAFKPRIKRKNYRITFDEEPEQHVIIACIRRGGVEIPTWPNTCVLSGVVKPSQLILNKTVENATILIPYPESGMWYATFRLFCGQCEPCNCSDSCQKQYEECTINCDLACGDIGNCSSCADNCKQNVIEMEDCAECDCDGPCLRNQTNVCNSSVVFSVASQPCVSGQCTENGRCMFMVSDGVVFSTCVCSNKYRGWDCSDGSLATPYYLIVIELLLLVFSNLMFLPAVYIAFKRKYYIEAITYMSICIFSTFYHACDAGENIISFCLFNINALQFGDFFCALLAIWVTLIAIADLSSLLTSCCHMIGAIVLAFCTTVDRTALWIFALPGLIGILIIAISWYIKYRNVKQRFANRTYLYVNMPVGVVVVTVGLIMYAFLQTSNNYKYVHSLWHIIMAVDIIIILPKPNTFLPEVLL